MNPLQLVDEIRRRRERDEDAKPLSVWWVALSGDRDQFAEALLDSRSTSPIIPWILRTPGLFRDPNAVMNDISYVLGETQHNMVDVAESARRNGGIDVIVLSRTELELISTSSPILLPEWFPVTPGRTVTAQVHDLTWDVNVSMADEILELDDLRGILHNLDMALADRWRQCHEADHRRSQAIWAQIRRDSEQDIISVIDDIQSALSSIRNTSNYRPSTKQNKTMIERLWFLSNTTSPDKLHGKAKALAQALCAEELRLSDHSQPLLAVLGRPGNPIPDASVLWCYQLIVTLRNACQMVTTAAHADEYPPFPRALLKTVSLDLRRPLRAAIHALRLATGSSGGIA